MPISQWSPGDVAEWLASIGLDDVAGRFRRTNGRTLLSLSLDRLTMQADDVEAANVIASELQAAVAQEASAARRAEVHGTKSVRLSTGGFYVTTPSSRVRSTGVWFRPGGTCIVLQQNQPSDLSVRDTFLIVHRMLTSSQSIESISDDERRDALRAQRKEVAVKLQESKSAGRRRGDASPASRRSASGSSPGMAARSGPAASASDTSDDDDDDDYAGFDSDESVEDIDILAMMDDVQPSGYEHVDFVLMYEVMGDAFTRTWHVAQFNYRVEDNIVWLENYTLPFKGISSKISASERDMKQLKFLFALSDDELLLCRGEINKNVRLHYVPEARKTPVPASAPPAGQRLSASSSDAPTAAAAAAAAAAASPATTPLTSFPGAPAAAPVQPRRSKVKQKIVNPEMADE